MISGEKLFLAQLQYMTTNDKILDWDDLDEEKAIQELAKRFNVPTNFIDAFRAYAIEYLLNGKGHSTNECGPFHNDKDTKDGIWNKVYYFYEPLVQEVIKEYPDLEHHIVIDPSYEDSTNIVIMVNNHITSTRPLSTGIVLFNSYWKVWYPITSADHQNSLYSYLEGCYKIWKAVIDKALTLNAQHTYTINHISGGQLAGTWSCTNEDDALRLAKYIATDVTVSINDEVTVDKAYRVNEGSDIIAFKSEQIWSWGGGRE